MTGWDDSTALAHPGLGRRGVRGARVAVKLAAAGGIHWRERRGRAQIAGAPSGHAPPATASGGPKVSPLLPRESGATKSFRRNEARKKESVSAAATKSSECQGAFDSSRRERKESLGACWACATST